MIHLRKGPEYLTRATAPVFILLIRFLLDSLVSSKRSSSLRYSFLIFSFYLHLFDGVSLQDAQVFIGFIFSKRSNLVLIW